MLLSLRGDVVDLQTIVSMIGSLGFPIVACVILFNSIEKERVANNEQREKDRSEHRAEMEKITEALNNNTLVMQKLIDTLTYDGNTGRHSDSN